MRTIKYISTLLLFLGLGFGNIQAQNFNFGKESIQLFTDRTLFVCGESIQYYALLKNQTNQSKILYVELILPDGTSLVSQKNIVSDKHSVGELEIPQSLLTGTYYLKAYTKYMRNFGATSFEYVPIKIVNPYSKEFLNGIDKPIFDTISSVNTPLIESESTDGINYKITLNTKELQYLKQGSISIIPSNSFQISNFNIENNSTYSQKYYPETRGLSLSGQLLDSISKEPLAFKEITLSIIDQKNFIPNLSKIDGRFYFSLPEIKGNYDLFISTKKEEGVHPMILVDRDYDTEIIDLPNPPFKLSSQERLTVLKLAQTLQIKRNYFTKIGIQKLDTFLTPFYGKPNNILYLDKYINMGTLEEYFTELPGLVSIKNHKNKKSFSIFSTLHDMSVYSPLVLIDMVAVEDYNRILAVSPLGIEKVDIIPFPYVYGDFIYGGIISIRTRKGDFGGISLPKTGLFFNFDFIQDKVDNQNSGKLNRIPDTRNTLFWKVFSLENESSLEITFKKASSYKDYWIIIQGIDKNQNIIIKKYKLK